VYSNADVREMPPAGQGSLEVLETSPAVEDPLGIGPAAVLGLEEVESGEVALVRESVEEVAPWVRPQVVAEEHQNRGNPLMVSSTIHLQG
jgi:hypothetical protein